MRVDAEVAPKAVALAVRTSKFRSWRKPKSRLSRETHQRWGFSQIAVLDADWVNYPAVICSSRTSCAAEEREEEVVPDPGHSWAQQRASHSPEEGRS